MSRRSAQKQREKMIRHSQMKQISEQQSTGNGLKFRFAGGDKTTPRLERIHSAERVAKAEAKRERRRRKLLGFVAMFLLLLVGCNSGTGVFTGKLIDVTWEGRIYKSCEIGVQFGQNGSRVEYVSSRSFDVCQHLRGLIGHTLDLQYNIEAFSFTTERTDVLTEFKVID